MDEVVGREILDQDHIGYQACPPVDPFEKVMAEQRILRYAPRQAPLESPDIVNPLADIDPLAEQVLVNIRDRQGVEI
jgi:hypothetical protein